MHARKRVNQLVQPLSECHITCPVIPYPRCLVTVAAISAKLVWWREGNVVERNCSCRFPSFSHTYSRCFSLNWFTSHSSIQQSKSYTARVDSNNQWRSASGREGIRTIGLLWMFAGHARDCNKELHSQPDETHRCIPTTPDRR